MAAAAAAAAAPPGLAWPSLADYWRTGSKMVWDAVTKRDLLILHMPRERMRALKAQAAGGWWVLLCMLGSALTCVSTSKRGQGTSKRRQGWVSACCARCIRGMSTWADT